MATGAVGVWNQNSVRRKVMSTNTQLFSATPIVRTTPARASIGNWPDPMKASIGWWPNTMQQAGSAAGR